MERKDSDMTPSGPPEGRPAGPADDQAAGPLVLRTEEARADAVPEAVADEAEAERAAEAGEPPPREAAEVPPGTGDRFPREQPAPEDDLRAAETGRAWAADAAAEPQSGPEPDPAPGPEPAPTAAALPAAAAPGRSAAGLALRIAALLLAGGVLFLWAGPRIAPHLPAGLSGLAAFLAPGAQDRAAEIAALRAELEARIAAVAAAPAAEVQALLAEAEARSAAERAAVEAALTDRITALSDQVAASDSGAIESRLAAVEAKLAGLSGEMAGWAARIEAAATADAAPDPEAAARIAGFAAAVDGLRAELQALAAQTGALGQRIDEVEAASRRREEAAAAEAAAAAAVADAARQSAALRAALDALGRKLDQGGTFAAELSEVATLTGAEVPAELSAAAADGVPTLAALQAAFPEAAHAAIRASALAASGDGPLGRAASFLGARLATRSLEEREGTDTDAILSRVGARLNENRLDAALAEADTLPPEARAALEGWIGMAKSRAAALAAFGTLSPAPDATN
jgi:hypothetical protein